MLVRSLVTAIGLCFCSAVGGSPFWPSHSFGQDVAPLTESLGRREALLLRVSAKYKVEVGGLEGVSTNPQAGEAHVKACAAAKFVASDVPAIPVALERDMVTSALHLRYGAKGVDGPMFEEDLFDGDVTTHLLGVDKNSRVQAEISKGFKEALAGYSTGHPRPDLLSLSPVAYKALSVVLKDASTRAPDVMGRPALVITTEGDQTVCVFNHLEPTIIPNQGAGHRFTWHRIFFEHDQEMAYPTRVDELSVMGNTNSPRISYFLEDHRLVNGVKLPFRVRAFQFVQDRTLVGIATIQEWKTNDAVVIPAELEIPAGTTVTDLVANRKIRKAMSPNEIDIRVNEATDLIRADEGAPAKFSLRHWLIVFNVVGLILFGIGFFYFRRTKRDGKNLT